MKTVIRNNVFETNSSSTHTLSVCTPEQYEYWKDGFIVWSNSQSDDSLALFEGHGITDEDLELAKTAYQALSDADSSLMPWESLSYGEQQKWTLTLRMYYKDDDDGRMPYRLSYAKWKHRAMDFDMNTFEEHVVTPNGEPIVVFGTYSSND